MSDIVNIEDVQNDSPGTDDYLKRPVHHLSPISPTRLIREISNGSSNFEELFVEDFNTMSNVEQGAGSDDTQGAVSDDTQQVQVSSDRLPPSSGACHKVDHVCDESVQLRTSHLSGCGGSLEDCRVLHSHPHSSQLVPIENKGYFRGSTDIAINNAPNKHLQTNDCELVNDFRKLNLFKDVEFDGNSSSQFYGLELDVKLIDRIEKMTISKDLEFEASSNLFTILNDVQFDRVDSNFTMPNDLDFSNRSSSFTVHKDLDLKIPHDIRVIGENDCTVGKNKPEFFVTEAKNVDMKNDKKFSIPKDHEVNAISNSNSRFYIPNYYASKEHQFDPSKNTRFYIYKDLKTYTDTSEFTVPEDYTKGLGNSSFYIPVCPSGTLKRCAKSIIPSDAKFCEGKSTFSLPPEEKESVQTNKCKFSIPGKMEISNGPNKMYVQEIGGGEVNSKLSFKVEESVLLDTGHSFSIYKDWLLFNVNLGCEINDLEIKSSQLSL